MIGTVDLSEIAAQNRALAAAVGIVRRNEALKAEAARLGVEIPALPPRRTMRAIAEAVAGEEGLTLAQLSSPRRTRRLARARWRAWWLMRQEFWPDGRHRYSLPQMGDVFGRDHTTVIHGLREYEKLLAAERVQ